MESQAPALIDVPLDFRDPITFELMVDPVLLVETGHTYNRQSITNWFRRGHRTCPKTNRNLRSLLLSTNWSLRSIIASWADQQGVPLPFQGPPPTSGGGPSPPPVPALPSSDRDRSSPSSTNPEPPSTSAGPASNATDYEGGDRPLPESHPISFDGEHLVDAHIRETWTFFEDSPGGDLLRLHFDNSLEGMPQLIRAADKVPNCIAFNSSGYLKQALMPRPKWVVAEDPSWSGGDSSNGGNQLQVWMVAEDPSWSGGGSSNGGNQLQVVGGDICQAITASSFNGQSSIAPGTSSVAAGAAGLSDGRVGPVITSTSSLALLAVARPFCVAFNSNGWLKALLQPMHGWVKWTTETGKGLFVRNDVLMRLLGGVLAHVQGAQSAPVQLAGWTFFQGMDSLGGDVHWSWQNQNDVTKLAQESASMEGVIAFTTSGYLKTALRPRNEWLRVDVWIDKPSQGIYINNAVLWKLLLT
eukprot:gene31362-6523_t